MPKKILILIVLIIFSCRKKENIIKRFSSDDKIISESEYIIVGNDSILHGKSTLYDILGNKIGVGTYNNGKLNGIYTTYFSNGKIKETRNYKDEIIIGDRIYYFDNGLLRKYILYDEKGKVAFIIKFAKTGDVENYEGHPIVDVEYKGEKNIDSLRVGDSLYYKYIVVKIPASKSTFSVRLLDFDNGKIYRKISERKNCIVEVKEKVVKKGKNSIKAILTQEFNDSFKTQIIDSLRFDFYAFDKKN